MPVIRMPRSRRTSRPHFIIMGRRIGKCKECGTEESWINQNGICGYCHIHQIDIAKQFRELKEAHIL